MIINSYICIPVSNIERAAEWYNNNLGFRIIYKDALFFDMRTESGIPILLIPNEKDMVSQIKYSTGEQPAYGFVVGDFKETKKALQKNGVNTGEIINYCGRSFSIFDIDGNKIEIWENYEYNNQ